MGLLDSLFQAQTYGGQGGGLLDMLRQFQMQQQYQPSAGFPSPPAPATFADRFNALPNAPQPFTPSGRTFDSANYDPDTYANQAQPIAVGDYMMPRFGPAHLYEPKPQEAAIPPNAQPAVGQMPPGAMPQQAPQAPQQMMPPEQEPNRLMSGFQGFIGNLHNGPIGALAGGLGALVTGQRTDPYGIMQQQQNMTVRALRARGVSEPDIAIAMQNPDAMKALLPKLYPSYKPHNIGETAGAFSEGEGTFKPLYTSPKTEKLGQGESLVQLSGGQPGAPRTATPVTGVPAPTPKFEDVANIRKEVGALPETKRYGEAAPIFRSMVQSRDVNTSAADLDFVYGVAKIFDPESVVREGEMKLVGKAQSLPEDIKAMMGQVAMAKGRLTPEARQRILEVAQTRMKELQSAYDTRVKPYGEIAQRFNMKPEDVLPSMPAMPTLGPLKSQEPETGWQQLGNGVKIRPKG